MLSDQNSDEIGIPMQGKRVIKQDALFAYYIVSCVVIILVPTPYKWHLTAFATEIYAHPFASWESGYDMLFLAFFLGMTFAPAINYVIWDRALLFRGENIIPTVFICSYFILINIFISDEFLDMYSNNEIWIFLVLDYDDFMKQIFVRLDVIVYVFVVYVLISRKMEIGNKQLLLLNFTVFCAITLNYSKYVGMVIR